MNKSKIRKHILEVRKKNNSENLNVNFQHILKILQKKRIKGKTLGGYYTYNYEVNAIEVLKKFEKLNYFITLRKIKKNFQMDFFSWSSEDPLEINKYGIPEPISNKIKYPDILLVPIVAYDKDLNRIGYGGGFYDRYLEKIKRIKKVTTIGLAYSFQKVEKIITNKYDIKLDFIITEKN